MKKWLILALLMWPAVGWAGSWGGASVFQFPESLSVLHLRNNTNANMEFGTCTTMAIGIYTVANDTAVILIRPLKDLRTGGYTDDSAQLVLFWERGEPTSSGETLIVEVFPLKVSFGEGNGCEATTGTGEADWVDRIQGTAQWETGGAQGSGDIYGTVDTVKVAYQRTKGDQIVISIPGASVDAVIDYGLALRVTRTSSGFAGSTFCWFAADDYTSTTSYRPYFTFWESAPTSSATAVGAVTIGATTIGP